MLATAGTDERTRVLDALSGRARATTEVARRSGLSVAERILALLELDGRVERSGDGWRRRSERPRDCGDERCHANRGASHALRAAPSSRRGMLVW
jgi:hypothetical protein